MDDNTLYHWGLGNYNDYGRPFQIEEVDQVNAYQNRRTERTFQYGFTPYIVDRIASESVRVQTSYLQVEGPHESVWGYEAATGFLTSQNLFGSIGTFERSPQGNLSATTDGRGNRTVYGFSWGALADVQTPNTHSTATINADGTPAVVSNGVDTSTLYSYDGNGRVTWVRQSGFDGVHTEYDNLSLRFIRIGGGQSQTDYALDGFGRTSGTINRVNLKTRVERDACSRVTFSSAPYSTGAGTRGASWQFDVLGRVTRETDPAGGVTSILYNGVDITRTDAANRITTFEYRAFSGPASERLYSVHDATHVSTGYGYEVHRVYRRAVSVS